MKIIDIILSVICGLSISFLVNDFLIGLGLEVGFYYGLTLWIILPLIFTICLWVAYLIGRKLLFVFQAAKHLLVGSFATVMDLKIFEFLFLAFSIYVPIGSIVAKSSSFIISTFFKFWGNKYWAFQETEKKNIYKEAFQFFLITFVGLLIDVFSFYCFTEILGPQFSIPSAIWIKLSVIISAIIAALWNFSGYKFLVFKK